MKVSGQLPQTMPAVSLGNSSVSLDVGRPGAQTVAADQAEAPAAVLARAAE